MISSFSKPFFIRKEWVRWGRQGELFIFETLRSGRYVCPFLSGDFQSGLIPIPPEKFRYMQEQLIVVIWLGDAIAFVFQIRKCCTPSHMQYRLTKWRPILTKMLSSIEKYYWNLTLKGLLDLIREYKLLGYFLNQILGILHHIFSYICCHVSTFFCKPDMLLETLKNFTIYLFRSVQILYL